MPSDRIALTMTETDRELNASRSAQRTHAAICNTGTF
jgi:hypothetical protein